MEREVRLITGCIILSEEWEEENPAAALGFMSPNQSEHFMGFSDPGLGWLELLLEPKPWRFWFITFLGMKTLGISTS